MSLESALDALAALTLTGVSVVGFDAQKRNYRRADLPVLIYQLQGVDKNQSVVAVNPNSFAVAQMQNNFDVRVVFLYKPLGLGLLKANNEAVLQKYDSFAALVAANPVLGGILAEKMVVHSASMPVVSFLGSYFYGFVSMLRIKIR